MASESDQWHSIVIEQGFRWTDADGQSLCIWSTTSRTRRLREKNSFFSFVERESQAGCIVDIERIQGYRVCIQCVCINVCAQCVNPRSAC